jgi:hypothetical protein
MTMYASSAGKSGGEFFTPQEVSELLARITVVGKTQVNKVYETFMSRRIQTRANYVLSARLVHFQSLMRTSCSYFRHMDAQLTTTLTMKEEAAH